VLSILLHQEVIRGIIMRVNTDIHTTIFSAFSNADIQIFFIISLFVFGSIIGSFLNVVLFRYNTGRTLGGRSKCFSCKRPLGPIDLFPVLSYMAFGGKCRTCKSHISAQYPAVELLTAVLFVAVYLLYAPLLFISPAVFCYKLILGMVVMSILVLITVYDFKHKIIPDLFAFLFAAISFITMFVGTGIHGDFFIVIPSITQLCSGIILAFPFYFLWLISRGRLMGLGDAKLALGIGWFLGLAQGATAVIYAFWIGAVISVLLLCVQKFSKNSHKLSMKSEIPFAPFLILGLLIIYFFQYNMFSILEVL
jgi:prepilin signal peptidase PulO-like enzyme (type II secretory pathway)